MPVKIKYSDLSDYLSPSSLDYFLPLLLQTNLLLFVASGRRKKLGDFRFESSKQPFPSISVNAELLPDAFGFVLAHELAHYFAFKKYGKHVKPHGREWKMYFSLFLKEMSEKNCFSTSVLTENILQFSKNPKARNELKLNHILGIRTPQHPEDNYIYLDNLPYGSKFTVMNRTSVFLKKHQLRKNFLCLCLDNNRKYSVSPFVYVKPYSISE